MSVPNEAKIQAFTLYVGTALDAERRRNQTSLFFGAAILSSLGLSGIEFQFNDWVCYLTALILSIIWLFALSSLRSLASVKWKVVLGIEEELGLSLFSKEWEILKTDIKNGQIFYLSLSKLELSVSLLSMLASFGLLANELVKN